MASNKITNALRNSSLLSGVQKRFPTLNLPSFPIGGVMYTLVNIVGVLKPLVDAATNTAATKAQWQKAVQIERDSQANARQFLNELKAAVYTLFGNHPDALADFGLLPKKSPKPQTTVTRVVAMAKGKQTRLLRHTSSPKAKLDIKGAVPATIEVSVPGALSGGTAPNAAPAATTSGGGSPQGSGNGAPPHA